MAANDKEMLILSDHEGNWYAIPREVVEKYKATDEQRAEIEETLGPDVQGYGSFMSSMVDRPATDHAAAPAAAAADMHAEMDTAAPYASSMVAAPAAATAARFAPASSLASPVFASFFTFTKSALE